MGLPENFQNKLLQALSDRGADTNCEICNHNNWSVLNKGVALNVSDYSGHYELPQPNIPSAALICNNCGNIRLFSLGVLDLTPEKEEKNETKDD